MITRIFFKKLGLLWAPLLERLERRFVVQVLLRDMVIIQVDEVSEGCLQGGGRVEAVGAQHVGDAAIEAFDHAVGARGCGFDQAMLDAVVGTDLIEDLGAGWWRSPVAQKRSVNSLVNSLPLSVRTVLMVKGAFAIKRFKKPLAAVADLSLRIST